MNSLGQRRPSILVVEDGEETKVLLQAGLEDDFRLHFASTLHSAREALENSLKDEHLFDGFLVDLNLPDGTGFEFCKDLNGDSRFEKKPIVFLTAETGIKEKTLGFELGAEDYIIKPFDPQDVRLSECVRRWAEVPADEEAAGRVAALAYRAREQIRARVCEAAPYNDTLSTGAFLVYEVIYRSAQKTARPACRYDPAAHVADLRAFMPFFVGFCLLFRRARKTAGLTQTAAGWLLGRTKNTVARWERGERTPEPLVQEAALARLREQAEGQRQG